MAVIAPSQTAARAPVNVSLMDELRRRSNSMYQPGDLKMHHSFNGAVLAGAGWFKCNGTLINAANYNSQRGSPTAWADEIGTSLLDGKYSPNLVGKYPVGVSSTTQTGASAITAVGLAGYTINLSHVHIMATHLHQWLKVHLNYFSTNDRQETYNVSGTAIAIPTTTTDVPIGDRIAKGVPPLDNAMIGDCYTNTATPTMGSQLSSVQNVQPPSIEVEYYIMIV